MRSNHDATTSKGPVLQDQAPTGLTAKKSQILSFRMILRCAWPVAILALRRRKVDLKPLKCRSSLAVHSVADAQMHPLMRARFETAIHKSRLRTGATGKPVTYVHLPMLLLDREESVTLRAQTHRRSKRYSTYCGVACASRVRRLRHW